MKTSALILATAFALAACSQQFAKEDEHLTNPVNCATADGDIRVLESEKAHVEQEMASGVFVVVPAAIVVGVATGTQEQRLEMAGGEYNAKIDAKIADIRGTCNL
jgi:hypothetical protein